MQPTAARWVVVLKNNTATPQSNMESNLACSFHQCPTLNHKQCNNTAAVVPSSKLQFTVSIAADPWYPTRPAISLVKLLSETRAAVPPCRQRQRSRSAMVYAKYTTQDRTKPALCLVVLPQCVTLASTCQEQHSPHRPGPVSQ